MRIALVLAAALMAAPAFAQGHEGHGAGGHEGHDMSHMDDMSRFGAPGDPAKASRTVTVKATEIAYDLKSLDVKTGETITFVLVNDGTPLATPDVFRTLNKRDNPALEPPRLDSTDALFRYRIPLIVRYISSGFGTFAHSHSARRHQQPSGFGQAESIRRMGSV